MPPLQAAAELLRCRLLREVRGHNLTSNTARGPVAGRVPLRAPGSPLSVEGGRELTLPSCLVGTRNDDFLRKVTATDLAG